ncbi:hypothetical protein PAE3662 [Pyrobaculum aerophilum str. IM2]|uniref:Uncharacterized protein n=2 Tax=Pyrobaculum aerophilum TaxID=13773 RepID=Q8ZSN4_PYRAE|nr:hypothetical protein [Pyrobaculum aerophilum]AAL65079.1 hypothetical protein PAE3662 [Pyrobaculum aerophilum str. IM2]HII47792.1 hypothetical protein [Pyrobaculum aerophilum]
MLFIPDIIIAVLALYVAYKIFQAWRSLIDWRLSLYSFGLVMLAASLIIEAVVDIYLNNLLGEAPMQFIRRQETFFRAVIQLLSLAALVPIAVAVTPSLFYAVLPPVIILVPINALLSLYIAAVTLIKSLERRNPPFISLAFISYALSLVAPLLSNLDLVARLLTAVFLTLGVIYGSQKAK